MFDILKRWLNPASALPARWQGKPVIDMPMLAIDLELTSLDPSKAKITSIGWVEGQGGRINLDSAYYQVVRASGSLEQSPVIHGLTPESLDEGIHISEALDALLPYAATHIWVFHNMQLDTGVLDKVMKLNDRFAPQVLILDTLTYAVYQLEKQHQVLPPNSATLTVCRQRLGLPLAPAHNALDDALATLQLWYAQYFHFNHRAKNVPIDDFLRIQVVKLKDLGKKCETGVDKRSDSA
ncbi:3'-5' exonuclease [Alteromonas sp. CYL-A6]|uniref:3'-5' exonuclease n=1 Tax=Alteromonas nitratireducens TaxID=3390813 RepID=UPI0034BC0BAB